MENTLENTMKHLGDLLYIFADLDDGDRCEAFDEALEYYNTFCEKDHQIEKLEGFTTYLVHGAPFHKVFNAKEKD